MSDSEPAKNINPLEFNGAAAAGPVKSHAAAADASFRSSQFINRFNKVQQMNQDMARGRPGLLDCECDCLSVLSANC